VSLNLTLVSDLRLPHGKLRDVFNELAELTLRFTGVDAAHGCGGGVVTFWSRGNPSGIVPLDFGNSCRDFLTPTDEEELGGVFKSSEVDAFGRILNFLRNR